MVPKLKWTDLALDGRIWNAIFTLPYKYVLPNKIKELLFKSIHRYYLINSIIYKYIPNIEDKCSFCNYMVETLDHLFIQCVHVTMFWGDFQLDLKI